MIDFITYHSNIFINTTNNEILKSEKHTIYVNSIIVCNTSANTITVNLTKTILDTPQEIAFIIKNYGIPAGTNQNLSTVDLVKNLGIEIFLPVKRVEHNLIGSSLNLYSGGINQNFDCTVDYSILTETPLSINSTRNI